MQNSIKIMWKAAFFHHNELASLDDVLQAGWKKGLYAVLFADYEFGLPLMDISSARSGNLRLHWFADLFRNRCRKTGWPIIQTP